MTLLISCQSIKPLVYCDLEFAKFSRCRCQCYQISSIETVDKKKCKDDWKLFANYNPELFEIERINDEEYLLPIVQPVNLSVKACNEIGGFQKRDIGQTIVPWGKKQRGSKKKGGLRKPP